MESPNTVAHDHIFLGAGHERNERKIRAVIWLCLAMMVLEIGGGGLFGSLALIADGLHMSTHAVALVISAFAYSYARRHALDARFAFGTGKLGDLAGFTSAVVLALIAVFILYEAATRLFVPVTIAFDEAIPIAFLGLGVNALSAWLLSGGGEHDHGHAHSHDHAHDHDHPHHHDDRADRDNNMRAVFIHVAADAGVSLLALVGLGAAKLFGWVWLDPVMGIVGALVIANWSWTLIRDTGGVLLDMTPDHLMAAELRQAIEAEGDQLTDFHLWRLGPGHLGAILSIATSSPRGPEFYRACLKRVCKLSHVTIEVQGPDAAP
jgi:cation diffusion facilitator family transporter